MSRRVNAVEDGVEKERGVERREVWEERRAAADTKI